MPVNIAVKIAFNRIADVRKAEHLSSISDQSTWFRGYLMALFCADLVSGDEYDRMLALLLNASALRKAELVKEIQKDLKEFKIPLDAPF